jgi:phage terminase|nr:MAG TPA: Large Terminase [Caudoviricetes sp.]
MIDEKYTSYARDVIDGKVVVCQYIRLACQRYLSWFNKEDRYFDEKAADRVVKFLQLLPQSTGKFAGKPLQLQSWQKWVIYSIFGFKHKKDGKRVVREVYIEVARKCGKSTLAAGIMLYMLTADGENEAQIIFAANSYSQAQLAFTMSKNFISHLDKKGKLFKTFRDQIKFPATKSVMKVVSADADKLDGLNSSAFVLDEYHAAKSNNVANVLTSSVGMREQPLMLYITTAGFDMTNPCYQLRSTYIDILDGKLQDDSIFSAIYTLDDGDDIEDESNWIKCQPNLDLTVTKEYIHSQLNKAKNSPLLLTNFKTKLMNIWCSNANGEWIGSNYINECTAKFDLSDSMFRGCSGYLGIDLSSTSDLTAISLMIPLSDRYYFKNWYYLPEVTLKEGANREKYAQWKRQGYLNITSGNVVDYNRVISDIEEINKVIPIECISYDQWQSTMAITQLTEKGFNCQPYSQTTGALNKPTRYMEIIARNGAAVFDDNPIIRWNFANCEIIEDSNENIKPVKINKDSQKKIDGVHAMLNALGKYLEQPQYDNTITGFTY